LCRYAAGDDRRLSEALADVTEIQRSNRFSKIYYEAMDVRVPGGAVQVGTQLTHSSKAPGFNP
jgi:hypothetical protein